MIFNQIKIQFIPVFRLFSLKWWRKLLPKCVNNFSDRCLNEFCEFLKDRRGFGACHSEFHFRYVNENPTFLYPSLTDSMDVIRMFASPYNTCYLPLCKMIVQNYILPAFNHVMM